MSTRTLRLNDLARVEGEGSLNLKLKNDVLEDVELRIFEPPRFFEAFLVGRDYTEVPDITARICGICPIAYQVSSCNALEQALGIHITEPIRALRRLIYCGEWIKSHALHIHMLHAPDFLGFPDAVAMAAVYPEEVKRGLRIKKAGNRLMEVVGGRAIHPVSLRVGGFTVAPSRKALLDLEEELLSALDDAIQAAVWVNGFEFPDFEPESLYVSMCSPHEYAICEGSIVSGEGMNIEAAEFEYRFKNHQVPYSTALHWLMEGRSYQTGPLARYNLNGSQLTPDAEGLVGRLGLEAEVRNPFKSIVIRAVETVFALEEAIRLISEYEEPDESYVESEPHACEGWGCSEAPRGICFHSYRLDDEGKVARARIVAPTAQNMEQIESDLRDWIPGHIGSEDLEFQSERAVRNYDPCISCSAHFLKLNIERLS